MHFHCIRTSAELFQVKDETIIHKRERASSLKRGQRKQKQTVYNFEKCKSILESINQFCSKWLTFVLVCYISITGILVIGTSAQQCWWGLFLLLFGYCGKMLWDGFYYIVLDNLIKS